MKINDMGKKDIVIKMVLMNGDNVSFVEFYSHADSRTHIINANRFCDTFGYSMEDLKQLQAQEEK